MISLIGAGGGNTTRPEGGYNKMLCLSLNTFIRFFGLCIYGLGNNMRQVVTGVINNTCHIYLQLKEKTGDTMCVLDVGTDRTHTCQQLSHRFINSAANNKSGERT